MAILWALGQVIGKRNWKEEAEGCPTGVGEIHQQREKALSRSRGQCSGLLVAGAARRAGDVIVTPVLTQCRLHERS